MPDFGSKTSFFYRDIETWCGLAPIRAADREKRNDYKATKLCQQNIEMENNYFYVGCYALRRVGGTRFGSGLNQSALLSKQSSLAAFEKVQFAPDAAGFVHSWQSCPTVRLCPPQRHYDGWQLKFKFLLKIQNVSSPCAVCFLLHNNIVRCGLVSPTTTPRSQYVY